jgi:hypothetical protein
MSNQQSAINNQQSGNQQSGKQVRLTMLASCAG